MSLVKLRWKCFSQLGDEHRTTASPTVCDAAARGQKRPGKETLQMSSRFKRTACREFEVTREEVTQERNKKILQKVNTQCSSEQMEQTSPRQRSWKKSSGEFRPFFNKKHHVTQRRPDRVEGSMTLVAKGTRTSPSHKPTSTPKNRSYNAPWSRLSKFPRR